MFSRFQSWRCKRVAKKVSEALKEQFGSKRFYSAFEVDSAAKRVGLRPKQREMAYAMFANEEACNGFLSQMGSTQTAKDLRKAMAGTMFGATAPVGYDALWNRFHDYNNEVIGGIQTVGGSSGGGGGYGGGGYEGFDASGGSDDGGGAE